MKALMNRRVAVTGVGVVSPVGIGADAFWAGLSRPAGVRRVRRLDGFDARRWMPHKQARTADIATQMAVAAADEALSDAGLLAPLDSGEPPLATREVAGFDAERAAVSLGTGIGGVATLETQAEVLRERGERQVSPHVVPMTMPNAAAAALSIRYGLRGTATTVTTACAAGADAIASGARMIAGGTADLVVAGGSDSSLTPTCVTGFTTMRAAEPERSVAALRRGAGRAGRLGGRRHRGAGTPGDRARPRCAGLHDDRGCGFDRGRPPRHRTPARRLGRGAVHAARDRGRRPGSGRHRAHQRPRHVDRTQRRRRGPAIRRAFSAVRPLVTSIKGATGHSFGAAGAIEAVAVALTIGNGTVPPTLGLSTQDPALDIDLARTPTIWVPGPVLSNSFGFGGHNACLVLAPPPLS